MQVRAAGRDSREPALPARLRAHILGGDPLRRCSRRISSVLCLATALCALLANAAALAEDAAAPDPAQATKVVEDLHAVMLGVMKDAKALGYEGRLAKLQPAIAE